MAGEKKEILNDGSIESPLKPQRDFTAERDAEVLPCARELLNILASKEDLIMGMGANFNEQKAALYYQDLYVKDIVPLLLKYNLKLNAFTYLFQVVLQPFQLISSLTETSMDMNRDLADAKKYNLKDIADLRLADLDNALKEVETKETVDKSL